MKKPLLGLLLVLPLLVSAQQKIKSKASAPQKQEDILYSKPLSLQLQAGTQGVGADLRYGLFKRLSLRAGASFIPVSKDNLITLPGFKSDNTASINFYNAHLLADFVPFKGMRGFRLVGGAAYLYKASGALAVTPVGNYTYGNSTYTPADIGTLNMDVSWKGIAPYAGIGLFKSFPNHFFNFNLDLGTYYLTQPSTHVVGTGVLSPNNQLEPQFNDNLKEYRWLPVIQLNFNFRLK
ncbi:MAG: hypothetical protein ABIN91_23030 [Mucilaginibacter sp.]|uniref:hypothetical protein n=1 Tax=Mucilaginibacter sp. TaxID=1882438 RepID=UPI0032637ADD